jgi:hypothetical protein
VNKILAIFVLCLLLLFLLNSCSGVDQSDYDKLKTQNSNLQTQLTQSQQNVTQLQNQLTQAQQKITDLQTKLNQITIIPTTSTPTKPVLTKGPEVDSEGNVWGGGYASVAIDLNENEQVQGEITKPYLTAIVQDPNGKTVITIGSNAVQQFSFTAEKTGRYVIFMNNTNNNVGTAYSLKYWVYSVK